MDKKNVLKTIKLVVWVILAAVLVIFAVIYLKAAKEDTEEGTVSAILVDTTIEYVPSVHRPNEKIHVEWNKIYQLKGRNGVEWYTFELYESEISEELRNMINEQSSEITVQYYQRTKNLVRMEIVLDDGSVVVWPESDAPSAADTGSGEQSASDAESAPKELTLSDIGLEGIKEGDDYTAASKVLSDNWFSMEMQMPNQMNEYQKKREEIKERYGVADGQKSVVFSKQDIEVILIVDEETMIVERIIVREAE